MTDRRLLLVHAHPDDEATSTGPTIGHYARLGADVTLVTCARGERGAGRGPHGREDDLFAGIEA